VPALAAAEIGIDRVSRFEALHEGAEIPARRGKENVGVVGKDGIGVHADFVFRRIGKEPIDEAGQILVVAAENPACITSYSSVVNSVFEDDPERAWHTRDRAANRRRRQG